MNAPHPAPSLTKNVTRVSHLDLQGAGQVYVDGNYAYVGHITNKEGLGHQHSRRVRPEASEAARAAPGRRQGLAQPQGARHRRHHDRQHGAEHDRDRPQGRRAAQAAHAAARGARARPHPRGARREARREGVRHSRRSRRWRRQPYDQGGFKIYDVSDRAKPKLITHHKTHGRGVHRFDMDANYAYISTEMPGYIGNILVIYDIRNPAKPEEVSRWWLPGQHLAGGEKPTWPGRQHRLHHALRIGDRLWAGCWHGGVRVIDVSDIRKPKTIGEYNYHPPFPEPSHTFMGLPKPIDGRQHRGRDRRGRPRQQRRGNGEAPRPPARLPVGVRHHRSHEHQAAVDLRGERTRFAVEPRRAGTLRRAPVPGAHEGRRHADVLRVVRGRPAHRGHRRSRPRRRKSATSSPSPRRAASRRRRTMSTWTSAG